MVKILDVQIKVIDEKNHITFLKKEDIELDTIVIKKNDTQQVITVPEKLAESEPKKEPKKKTQRKKKVKAT